MLLRYIREKRLMRAGDRVCVAVSGGADSVALLRLLLALRSELGVVLAVAHFNHQLRAGESDADEAFVADLARQHGLEFFAGRANVREHAGLHKLSIEAAARELRYRWLDGLAEQQRLDSVATAHTFDDQAETVLLKFLRGAGTKGLSGVHPELRRRQARIIRPLLTIRREDVVQYLRSLGQSWREDTSNLDRHLLRNRMRHELLPLLERDYNPNVRQLLNETAEIAQAEEEYWQMKARSYLDVWHEEPGRLRVHDSVGAPAGLLVEPVAFQRRVVKCFLEGRGLPADFQHFEMVRRCMNGEIPKVGLPGGWQARREGDWLELSHPSEPAFRPSEEYEKLLPLPGACVIPEAHLTVRATVVPAEAARNEPPGSLLEFERFGESLTIRNWRPGDRFWPAHSGSEEKLKRLLAELRVPAEQRPTWPVALSAGQIVWVRGFPVARAFAWSGAGDAVRIETL